MQIRVLGQFEVTRGEIPVTLSQGKLRQAFALLAINVNQVVHIGQLITELWGTTPPEKAIGTLQTHMSHLRKLLAVGVPADGTATILHTRNIGYTLTLPDDAVDAWLFTELVDRGQAEFDHGKLEVAAVTLRDALALWRGRALSDVSPGPELEGHVRRLEEIRIAAIEQHTDIQLMLGRHGEVITTLGALVREHPVHEGLHAKLITALHRAGRRGEALKVFQRIRTALIESLGLEPGPQLQSAQRALLVGNLDQAVATTGAIHTSALLESPAQLPPDVPAFIGRTDARAAVEHHLANRTTNAPAVVTVVGPPGAGKTAFCVHSAHAVRARFPHGQFHADLAKITPEQALDSFLHAIFGPTGGLPNGALPNGADARARLFHNWTDRRRVLVVLDNVVSEGELTQLIPQGSGGAAIIGTRTRLSQRAVGLHVELPRLTEHEALELLSSIIGWGRLRRELDAARQLIHMFSALPAALVACGGRLAVRPHWSIGHLVERLRNEDDWPDELVSAQMDVLHGVELTCRALPAGHGAAFLSLVRNTAPISVSQAADILGVDRRSAELTLETLVEFQLADVEAVTADSALKPFRYRFAPLVRACAARLIQSDLRLIAAEGDLPDSKPRAVSAF
ncbi:AfsR/SARP family transcriptional regulator [Kutzneria buriramensis]|uniref:DNA-binding SARP family transcriptional activator n=1 Tax=Kutzneria buriramensis TaxID=1045776 RepID=A0A3E0GW61_9PSEU|nr:AfsR/SARP family transcriptional regulator [Kutzneria buriramensis]REH28576.1 DNA-binding SARP family transcriptional activator [Kutzneria buriramensis]